MTPDRLPSRSTKSAVIACAVLSAGLSLTAAAQAAEPADRSPLDAARDFLPRVEAFIAEAGLAPEKITVRTNGCDDGRYFRVKDVYQIWIGIRAVAPEENASAILDKAHEQWRANGWEIRRYQQLEGGGRNLLATDPETGDGYTLDSGFAMGPERYVVSMFNTPCFRDPGGKADFGLMSLETIRDSD